MLPKMKGEVGDTQMSGMFHDESVKLSWVERSLTDANKDCVTESKWQQNKKEKNVYRSSLCSIHVHP